MKKNKSVLKKVCMILVCFFMMFLTSKNTFADNEVGGTGNGNDSDLGKKASADGARKFVYAEATDNFGIRLSLYKYTYNNKTGNDSKQLAYITSVDYFFNPSSTIGVTNDIINGKRQVYTCGGTTSGSLNYKYLNSIKTKAQLVNGTGKIDISRTKVLDSYVLVTKDAKVSKYNDFYNSMIRFLTNSTGTFSTRIQSLFDTTINNAQDIDNNPANYYITAEPTVAFVFQKQNNIAFYGTAYELNACYGTKFTVPYYNDEFPEVEAKYFGYWMDNVIRRDLPQMIYNAPRESNGDPNNFTNTYDKEPLVRFYGQSLNSKGKLIKDANKDTGQINESIKEKNSPFGIAIYWLGGILDCASYCAENTKDSSVTAWNACSQKFCQSHYSDDGALQESCNNTCKKVAGTCDNIPTALNDINLSATCNGSTDDSAQTCELGSGGYYRVICDEEVSTSKYPGVTTHYLHDGSTSSFNYEYSISYEKTCHIEWFVEQGRTWKENNTKIPDGTLAAKLSATEKKELLTFAKNQFLDRTRESSTAPDSQIYIENAGDNTSLTIWADKTVNSDTTNLANGTVKYNVSYSIGNLYRRTIGDLDYKTYASKSSCEGDGNLCIETNGYYYVSYSTPIGDGYSKESTTSGIGIFNQWNIVATCHYNVEREEAKTCPSTCNGLSGTELAKCATKYCSKYYLGNKEDFTTCINGCSPSECIIECSDKTGEAKKECAKLWCGSTSNTCYQLCTAGDVETTCDNCEDATCINKEISKCDTEECKRSCCVTNCNIVYKDDKESINTCISNVCSTTPGTLYDKVIFRPININNPFPNDRKPGDNWWNKIEYITNETSEIDNEYYDSTPSNGNTYEYRFIITPSDMSAVRDKENGYSQDTVYFKYTMSTKVDRIGGISKEQAISLNTSPTYCSAFIHDYLIGQVLGVGRYNVENGACK